MKSEGRKLDNHSADKQDYSTAGTDEAVDLFI